ncbi:MAG: 2Fe-2S iron-sulfur cluster-binding protein, partial [Anaerolineales bacterium]
MFEICINNQRMYVDEGCTVLQAVHQAGEKLDTLCYLEGLPPYGACRLCLV